MKVVEATVIVDAVVTWVDDIEVCVVDAVSSLPLHTCSPLKRTERIVGGSALS